MEDLAALGNNFTITPNKGGTRNSFLICSFSWVLNNAPFWMTR